MHQRDWNAAYSEDHEAAWDTPVDQDVSALAADLTPGTALDLGCGVGQNSLWLAERGWKVTGIDIASNAIDKARRDAASRGLDATFVVGDTTVWRPDRHYDLVVSTYALPAGDEQRSKALATATAAVAVNGTLLITELHRDGAEQHGFNPDELVNLDSILPALDGFSIDVADKITAAHSHGHQSADWPIVVVKAVRN